MSSILYKQIKSFKGLKNDEDAKQISIEYFSDILNFNYPNIGILGIDKILMPKTIAIFLSPDLEINVSNNITIENDSLETTIHSGSYYWGDPTFKWDLSQWS